MLLYIHGFNSTSGSGKAQALKQWLDGQGRGSEWACPDLPHQPAAAIAELARVIESAKGPVKLIGSSLGGFYATVLAGRYGVRAVLINPAVHPHLLLREALGRQKNWHTGDEYDFTQSHLNALAAMDEPAPAQPSNTLLLVETGDEVLDYRDAVAYYRDCHQIILQGGDHGFSRFVDLLPFIDHF
jgi:predicted esterase YcpF (UPF0227 family)